MAELGIIASVVQIADVGLRLSLKLYTFGEIVASADRSVISISKDVSLTSGVLKELGQILDKDKETRTFSENAVQTADGVVKECLEVFQEMENILVKKMPNLGGGGKERRGGERAKRATVMLERLKWGYLQPKLQLLRSNLDRLKSTLLLMLNVITYARQVSGNTESPSVIAEQRSLIEDLAHSNQEYICKFERLKLGIEGPALEHVDDALNIGAIERESSTTTRSLPGASTPEFERMKFDIRGTPLQDKENSRALESRELTTATRSSPKAQSSVTRSLATRPNANNNNVFINTSVQTNIAMPPLQERGIPTTEPPMGFEQEVLFKQLEHYSMLIKNLLKEVDEAQYKITFKSRLRVKGGIAGLHEGERQELEKMWGRTALQSAEQKLESLVDGLEDMPRMNRLARRDPIKMFSLDDTRRMRKSTSRAADGSNRREKWLDLTQNLHKRSMSVEVSEDQSAEALPIEKKDDTALGEHFHQSQEEFARERTNTAANGNWQQGPPGQAPMIQTHQPQQGVQIGTPQQRNEMPPRQAVFNAAANGRLISPTAPPTLQITNKIKPKGKKDARERKKPTKKNSTASVPFTPASEAKQPPTSTPATPVTPQNPASFAPFKSDGQDQDPANMIPDITSAAPDQLVPQQQNTKVFGFNDLDRGVDESYSMPFNSDLNNSDKLENFNFEHFLHTIDGDFNFDSVDEGAEAEAVAESQADGELVNAQWGLARKGCRPRKRRTAQNPSAIACTACREKRMMCDRAEPKCVNCKQSGSECAYRNNRNPSQRADPDLSSNVEPDPARPMFQRDDSFSDSAAEAKMEADQGFINGPISAISSSDVAFSHDVGNSDQILELHDLTRPKKYNRAYKLRSHLRNHTRERPFPCTVCGESFARLFDLKRHVALHSGEESHANKHDPVSDIDSNVRPAPDPDPSLNLDKERKFIWPELVNNSPDVIVPVGTSYNLAGRSSIDKASLTEDDEEFMDEVQHGLTSKRFVGSTPPDPEGHARSFPEQSSEQAPISTRAQSSQRPVTPRWNPIAPSSKRIFTRGDAKKTTKGEKTGSKNTKKLKDKDCEKEETDEFDSVLDSSPQSLRLSRDAQSITTATSTANSHDSFDRSAKLPTTPTKSRENTASSAISKLGQSQSAADSPKRAAKQAKNTRKSADPTTKSPKLPPRPRPKAGQQAKGAAQQAPKASAPAQKPVEDTTSGTPSEVVIPSKPKGTLMQNITCKSSSSKFNVPWGKKRDLPSSPGEIDELASTEELVGKSVDNVLDQGFHQQARMQQHGIALGPSAPMANPSGPTYPPNTLSTSALAKVESPETQRTAAAPTSIQDPGIDFDLVDSLLERGSDEWWQRESEQDVPRIADMEVVDRLVFLWTTVKPL